MWTVPILPLAVVVVLLLLARGWETVNAQRNESNLTVSSNFVSPPSAFLGRLQIVRHAGNSNVEQNGLSFFPDKLSALLNISSAETVGSQCSMQVAWLQKVSLSNASTQASFRFDYAVSVSSTASLTRCISALLSGSVANKTASSLQSTVSEAVEVFVAPLTFVSIASRLPYLEQDFFSECSVDRQGICRIEVQRPFRNALPVYVVVVFHAPPTFPYYTTTVAGAPCLLWLENGRTDGCVERRCVADVSSLIGGPLFIAVDATNFPNSSRATALTSVFGCAVTAGAEPTSDISISGWLGSTALQLLAQLETNGSSATIPAPSAPVVNRDTKWLYGAIAAASVAVVFGCICIKYYCFTKYFWESFFSIPEDDGVEIPLPVKLALGYTTYASLIAFAACIYRYYIVATVFTTHSAAFVGVTWGGELRNGECIASLPSATVLEWFSVPADGLCHRVSDAGGVPAGVHYVGSICEGDTIKVVSGATLSGCEASRAMGQWVVAAAINSSACAVGVSSQSLFPFRRFLDHRTILAQCVRDASPGNIIQNTMSTASFRLNPGANQSLYWCERSDCDGVLPINSIKPLNFGDSIADNHSSLNPILWPHESTGFPVTQLQASSDEAGATVTWCALRNDSAFVSSSGLRHCVENNAVTYKGEPPSSVIDEGVPPQGVLFTTCATNVSGKNSTEYLSALEAADDVASFAADSVKVADVAYSALDVSVRVGGGIFPSFVGFTARAETLAKEGKGDEGGATLSLWLKVESDSYGFVFITADASATMSVANHENVSLSFRAIDRLISQRVGGSAWYRGTPPKNDTANSSDTPDPIGDRTYFALLVDGSTQTLSLFFDEGTADRGGGQRGDAGVSWSVSDLRRSRSAFNSDDQSLTVALFDGQWHFVAITVQRYSPRVLARLYVDAYSDLQANGGLTSAALGNLGSPAWMQCFPPSFQSTSLDTAPTLFPLSPRTVQEKIRPQRTIEWIGGIGLVGAARNVGVFDARLASVALEPDRLIALGSSNMRRLGATVSASGGFAMGGVLCGITLIFTIVIVVQFRLELSENETLSDSEDGAGETGEEVHGQVSELTESIGHTGGTIASSAQSSQLLQVKAAGSSALITGRECIARMKAMLTQFMSVAQTMGLYLSGCDSTLSHCPG